MGQTDSSSTDIRKLLDDLLKDSGFMPSEKTDFGGLLIIAELLVQNKDLMKKLDEHLHEHSQNLHEHSHEQENTENPKVSILENFIGVSDQQKKLIQILYEIKISKKGPIKIDNLISLAGYDKNRDGKPSKSPKGKLCNATGELRVHGIIISRGWAGYELCDDEDIINFLSNLFQ